MAFETIDILHLGPLHLRTWGLMVGLGLLAGAAISARLAPHRGIGADRIWSLALVTAASGLLGARVLWALQPELIERTLANPLIAFRVWDGGLTFVGGLIGATIGGAVYLRRAGIPMLRTLDVVAPGFGVGLAIGRIGCYLTGLHPGRPTSLPWGIEYLGAVRHPIPLYEAMLGLALAGLALLLLRRVESYGLVGLATATAYLGSRGLLDLLRASGGTEGADPRLLADLTLTQGVALVMVPLLVVLLVLEWTLKRVPIHAELEG